MPRPPRNRHRQKRPDRRPREVDAPGVGARRHALKTLDGVLRRDLTLETAAMGGDDLLGADRALASAIAGETLRRLPSLDAMIDGATRDNLPDDSKARMVLRLALAQRAALNIPDHAIVATALPLVAGGPRRLVHGVLGTLIRAGETPNETELPGAVEARWREAWGDEMVAAARAQILERPPLDLSFKDGEAAKAYPLGDHLAPRLRRIHQEGGAVTKLPGFGEGNWWAQDLSSSLPASLIPADAKTVIDACAAPGGKTMQLAAKGHDVIALDKAKSRLERLSENLQRTGLTATKIAANLLDWTPDAPVDAVLLDAPCSATGTFRRHPEVLYRARERVIGEMAEVQAAMLSKVADWVKPGGSLVYAVCSLEPEEGEAQVEAFLAARSDYELRPAISPTPIIPAHPKGWLRVLPGMAQAEGGADGFFTAHLVRKPL